MREQGALPLHGVRVLACELLVALPFGTQILADLGADVIGIEHYDYRDDTDSRWRLRTGRHKRRISVNLRDPRGQELVRRLAGTIDIFAENYRPGTMDRYGLGYARLSELHPGLVYVSMSGYGHADVLESPLSGNAAYGPIAVAKAGVAHIMGPPPEGTGTLALGDIVSTLFATVGMLAALRDRERTGRGQYVDVSMADSLLTLAERAILIHMLAQPPWSKEPAEPMPSGWGSFDLQARDGRYVLAIMESADEAHRSKFCELVGHPEWMADPEIIESSTRRAAVRKKVIPVVNEWAATRSKFEVASLLSESGLAAAPVLTPEETLTEPHFRARKMFEQVIDEYGRETTVVGNPIKLSALEQQRVDVTTRIARPGEHTAQVLAEHLGLSGEQIDELIAEGVVKQWCDR